MSARAKNAEWVGDRAAERNQLKRTDAHTAVHYSIPLNKQPPVPESSIGISAGNAGTDVVMRLPFGPDFGEHYVAMVVNNLRNGI